MFEKNKITLLAMLAVVVAMTLVIVDACNTTRIIEEQSTRDISKKTIQQEPIVQPKEY